ncbi:MAG TPA: hypothetical protein VMR06_02535 [Dokdonella sp.]|uniref:hypothetical protein n=1 Tax=Dokdonella sp. TaxID=2291710 RepID=UPI002C5D070D|nr:hypothetical protein [Dokdonella sp.]HUD40854.1 hypothetical protein [Dokdonella sp.]
MSMLRPLLVVAAAIAWGTAAAAAAGPSREIARALAREDGRLLYREEHWHLPGGGRLVLYRCPDGTPFARKTVAAGPSAEAPDFAFEDGRDGYREGVRSGAAGREVYVRDRADAAERQARLRIPDDAVVDAGFDAAVRTRWDALAAGTRLSFLLPSRLAFVPVRIVDHDRAADDARTRRLRMTLDTWFGFAVPAVDLVYDAASRRLLTFSGTGTIRDGRGRHRPVRIVFDAAPPAPVSPAALAAAQQVRLDGRCAL